jgi:mRNA-degrading endonuclease toxin of MazEF toxin-antitoxin module
MLEKLIKKFELWFPLKSSIDSQNKFPKYEEGQIWWCNVGENIGHEENGKGEMFLRPVLIIKKFNSRLFYGLPTSSIIKDNKYYFQINIKNKDISILLSQMRAMDAKRLLYKQARLPDSDFILVKKAISKIILGKI